MAQQSKNLRDLLGFSPERCEEMLRAALECYADGDFAQTETILVGLMTLAADDPRPVKLLASTCMLQGKDREAEALYEQARKMDPADPYTLVALGEIKLKALELSEAVKIFEELFRLDPDGTMPAANRGRELVKSYYRTLSDQD